MKQLTNAEIKKILEGQRLVKSHKFMGPHEIHQPMIIKGQLVSPWEVWKDFTIDEVEIMEDERGTFFLLKSQDGNVDEFCEFDEAERLARTRRDEWIDRDYAGRPVGKVVTRIILQKKVVFNH